VKENKVITIKPEDVKYAYVEYKTWNKLFYPLYCSVDELLKKLRNGIFAESVIPVLLKNHIYDND